MIATNVKCEPITSRGRSDYSTVVHEIDDALRSESGRLDSPVEEPRVRPESALARLPGIMRWMGAGAVIVAGVLFMLQGIHSIGFMSRHWIFLGITAGLGTLGLFLGTRLKETRGARTFLGLAVASLPVLFSQLGAMIHSLVSTKVASSMPEMFLVQALSSSAVALTTTATLLVTIPLVGLGFLVLVRPRAWILTAAHFAANACILLPGRDPTQVGLLVLAMTVLVYVVDLLYLRPEPVLRTTEGIFARLMLTAPIVTVLVRAIFGEISGVFVGCVLGAIGFAAFFVTKGTELRNGVKQTIQAVGACGMSIGWVVLAAVISNALQVSELITPFVAAIPVAGLLVALSSQVESKSAAGLYRALAALGLFMTIASTHLFGPDTWVSILSICCGSLVVVTGLVYRQKAVFILGLFGGATGLVSAVFSAVTFNAASIWAVPAGLGVLILIGASVLEMRKDLIATVLRKWNGTWKEPEDKAHGLTDR